MLIKAFPLSGLLFATLDWMKKKVVINEKSNLQVTLKPLLCGGVAGFVAYILTHPIDNIQT